MNVLSARVSAIAHATEDTDKVIYALRRLCPTDSNVPKIDRRRLRGHYGNEITTINMILGHRSAESFFHYLWRMLPRGDRVALLQDIDGHIDDDGRMHLRLDKQECFRGIFRLKDEDPIKIQVSFNPPANSGQRIAEQVRRVLEPLESGN